MLYSPEHGFPTADVAATYGIGEEGSAEENGARTGCVGCNLASRDTALDTLLKNPLWSYLAPFKRLKPLYAELTLPHNRLRKHHEVNKDGKLAKNQGRMGPLTFEARLYGLSVVLGIQDEINEAARRLGRPEVSLIDEEEHARIVGLIEAKTWPDKWTGDEATGDEPFVEIYRDGAEQPLLINAIIS
jgi:DNA sulfur modification protein DndC